MTSDRMFDAEHIELWRDECTGVPIPLGAFNWPMVLGLALDEIEALRAKVAAAETGRV